MEHAIEIADEEAAGEDEGEDEQKTSEVADTTLAEATAETQSPRPNDALSEGGIDEPGDDQLERAIANSMADTTDAPRTSRYLQYSSSPSPLLSALAAAAVDTSAVDVAALEAEQRELKSLRNRQMRDVEGFSDDMVEEVMALLRLFGVPYLVCPMEAEAQCAALEQLGLVDGIITDDSDIFAFGGQKVYKNIFHHQKFVEAFFAHDIERELGFAQDEIISLALLLGSDYTDGVRGIGIVNATEVVSAYPGADGLRDFKHWVQSFDLAEEAQRAAAKKTKHSKSDAEIAAMPPRERFQATHASARRKWELGDDFPSAQVVKAYKQPQVDRSDARFSWSLPDLAALRGFTERTFGWEQAKTDSVLLPVLEKAASAAGRGTQTRIDQFFRSYDDEVRYATIQSKRLRSAVESRSSTNASKAGKASTAGALSAPSAGQEKQKKVATKKKTTLAALGTRRKTKKK